MRHRFRLASYGVLALLVLGGQAFAQPAGEPPAGPGDGKPLKGKDSFDINKYESLWSPEKKKSEEAKAKAREEKIKKLLALVNDPTYANKADALFRLAETHWDQTKFYYFVAREKFEADMKCFEEKRCAEEPKEPIEDQSTAIDYYQKVLLADPNYERLDQVTYFLGRAKIESGNAKGDRQMQLDGEKYLKDVTVKWSKSPFVPNAHLTLAEYYFDKDSLFYAKTNYEAIIQKFPDNAMFNYALYKLGWVYFNLADFDKTIDTFHKVIAAMKGGAGSGLIEFREQALNDLIQAYAEVDNGWHEAREYFMKEVGEADTYDKLDKMAALLVTKDKDDEAVELYKHLIDHNKANPKIAEYYDAVLEVRRKLADMKETEKEINEISDFFDPKGAWFTANKANTQATEKAHELVSSNLAFMANYYHREAQQSEDKKKMADANGQYDNAVKYYARFLERYPDHQDAYKYNFFYAEILYDRGKFMEASEQYEKTLTKDLKGDFVEDAALGVVYSVDKELCRSGKRQCAEGNKEVQVTKVELTNDLGGGPKEEEIKQTPLDPLEQRMINAADRYVQVLSANLKDPEWVKKYPNRGTKIPNMMYVSAEMFFRHGMFKESVTRLQVIFDLFPKDEMASYSVNLIIDAYKRLKNWVQIEKWAREVIEKKNFTTRKKEDWEQIIAIAKTEYAKDLTLQRRFDEAIKVQQEIVEEFGRKNPEVASKALFNVGAIHEIARRFPEAVTAYEDVIKRYHDREVAVQAQAAIGILYESQTEFSKAAEAFVAMQQFKSSFAKNPAVAQRAADAYRDAGIIYEALEEYDKASEVFEAYTKLYANREDVPRVAFEAALSQEYKETPEAFEKAGKIYEKISKTFGRKDSQYGLRGTSAAGLAYKKADKVKNRKKVEGLFRAVTKDWEKLQKAAEKGLEITTETKYYAALATFELAEYAYDDYNKLQVEAVSKSGSFDVGLLKRSLTAKAEALQTAEKAFDKVLDFKDKGMAAAAAFRLGQILYEFAQSLFEAPVPPGLTPEQVDEYRFQLEEFAGPLQERALAAFTAALKQAVQDGVYNKWSRLSAIYAAKVNKDEFPIAEFTVQPDKTRDTVLTTSFIKAVRRGSIVVDYLNQKSTDTSKDPQGDGDADKKPDAGKPATPAPTPAPH